MSLRQRGPRDALWTVALLALAATLAGTAGAALMLKAPVVAGLFCGALTNTPALAAVLERMPPGSPEPVVGYSVAYPMGALGIVLAMVVARRRWGGAIEATARASVLEVRCVEVTRAEAAGRPVERLLREWGLRARFSRRRRDGRWSLVNPNEPLALGDLVTVVGMPSVLDEVTSRVGRLSDENVSVLESDFELRRIFVSDPAVAGRSLAELKTLSRFGALVTRVRRGDLDLVPDGRTVLELGDRVRVAAYEKSLPALTRLLGDSIRTITETDFLPLSLGLSVGVLLGMVSIPFPFVGDLRLGVAGGPLLVALVLGRLGKTGKILWGLPLEVNFTLRQFGLLLFLVGVGLRAGATILDPLWTEGPALVGLGAAATTTVALTTLLIGRFVFRINIVELLGIVAGVHTQPAALGIAGGIAGAEGTSLAYARVHPVATIIKIVIAQGILGLLG
jgi:putative transport protein